ncbi:hypothetical protein [Hymenobacter glacieicola]|uniref:Uncharacterized protein n=1 Tax=Hymenobacter glacieicola TaxID=1562124 RepID=A0ABQ1X9R5_9BACT|nr:hypothetical protein [Hymenobacter glacieicola]GGG60813.1 hypothetical protein GCM10011378_41050 [Hymenobacter glacieicola]
MSSTAELKRAFAPLLERTKRRVERIKQLQAQPQTEQTVRAIAAEQREIDLFRDTTTAVGLVFENLELCTAQEREAAEQVKARVVDVAEQASLYEDLFTRTLDVWGKRLPDPPDEQWPDVCRRAQNALFRMNHLHTSPATYAATFGLLPHELI